MDSRSLELAWYLPEPIDTDNLFELFSEFQAILGIERELFRFAGNTYSFRRCGFSQSSIDKILRARPHDEYAVFSFDDNLGRGAENFSANVINVSCALNGDIPMMFVGVERQLTSGFDAETASLALNATLERLARYSTGCGYFATPRNADFRYRSMAAHDVGSKDPIYLSAKRNIYAIWDNDDLLMPVLNGNKLRSYYRFNFLTKELFDTIARLNLRVDRTIESVDHVVLISDSPDDQRHNFDLLRQADLVTDDEWIDLEGYVPLPWPRRRS